MVVVRLETRAPLRPLSLAGSSPLLRKGIGRKSGPRCKLFGSPKDPEKNLRIASALIESSAAAFASRWSFDPVAEVPLPFGRISWSPLGREAIPSPTAQKDRAPSGELKSSKVAKDEPWKDPTTIDVGPDSRKGPQPSAPPLPLRILAPLIDKRNISFGEIDDPHPSLDLVSKEGRDVLTTEEHSRDPPLQEAFPSGHLLPKPKQPQDRRKPLNQTKITDYGRIAKKKKMKKEIRVLM